MKLKQSCPKSVRPPSNNTSPSKLPQHRVRCSVCDSLLKASTMHRYLLMGKSAHEKLSPTMTYEQCCEQYLPIDCNAEKLKMLCPKCCQDLHRISELHQEANGLVEKLTSVWQKTKRLKRAPRSPVNFVKHSNERFISSPLARPVTENSIIVPIKEEFDADELVLNGMRANDPLNIPTSDTITEEKFNGQSSLDGARLMEVSLPSSNSNNQMYIPGSKALQRNSKRSQSRWKVSNNASKKLKVDRTASEDPSHLPNQTSHSPPISSIKSYRIVTITAPSPPYAQLMVDSTQPSSLLNAEQLTTRRRSSSGSEHNPSNGQYDHSPDEEQSFSPQTNDDDLSLTNESKGTRLSRRQYNFLVKLPDQQSLNAFIETSSSESGSRWTWRRTSANSRGYKVYYVCNFSMRRHYHPCPAAMYALFHPEGSISIYSCGQHQHVPKDRLPVSITDATKDEIFKCLQAGMATTDIRERLTQLQLPYGDTRKLNNFIKYHKELLRFGTVTNVRIGGTAYRQPQCWAIRRQPGASSSPSSSVTNEEKVAS